MFGWFCKATDEKGRIRTRVGIQIQIWIRNPVYGSKEPVLAQNVTDTERSLLQIQIHLIFSSSKFFIFLFFKTIDPDWVQNWFDPDPDLISIIIQPKMLDPDPGPDPYQMNKDP
jgi:hypothetical protein